MELKFKNALFSVLYVASFASVCILLSGAICIFVTCIWEDGKDMFLCLIIFGSALLGVWIITCVVVLLSKTVIVTENEISIYRGKKLKYCVKKEDIEECIYNEMKWYNFLFPVSTINAFMLQFRLKNKKSISKEFCSLSLKQVIQIRETFGYPIRIISKIHEQ